MIKQTNLDYSTGSTIGSEIGRCGGQSSFRHMSVLWQTPLYSIKSFANFMIKSHLYHTTSLFKRLLLLGSNHLYIDLFSRINSRWFLALIPKVHQLLHWVLLRNEESSMLRKNATFMDKTLDPYEGLMRCCLETTLNHLPKKIQSWRIIVNSSTS